MSTRSCRPEGEAEGSGYNSRLTKEFERDVGRHPDPSASPRDNSSGPDNSFCAAQAIRTIYEGYLTHYDLGRVISEQRDQDLDLLMGDRLYALGLLQLAENGDLPAVAALSEVICETVQAQAEGREEDAAALWRERFGQPPLDGEVIEPSR